MAKVSPLLIFLLVLEVIRTCGVQTSGLNGEKLQNEDHARSKRSDTSDSLDLLQNIKLINEISMDEALVGPSARSKRSLKGGSVLRRRHARLNAAPWRFEFEKTQARATHKQARNLDRSQLGKRDVSRPFRRHRKTMLENGDRKRSMFLANLLFAQTEKMPQSLDTLFHDRLV